MMNGMSWIAKWALSAIIFFLAQDPTSKAVLLAGGEVFTQGDGEIFVADERLWLAEEKLRLATGFESKPEGLCREDICIPMPEDRSWVQVREQRSYLDLSAIAEMLDQTLVCDEEHEVWSLAGVPLMHGRGIESNIAPDFELPDLAGRMRKLSDFRGKKVLLLTWASW